MRSTFSSVDQPVVSVVIPTLNRPQMLPDAVTSVLQQSVQHLELIVVLDGPDAASRAAMEGLDEILVYGSFNIPRAKGVW